MATSGKIPRPKKPSSRKRKAVDKTPVSLEELQKTRDAGLLQFGKSASTRKTYARNLANGKKWLRQLVEREIDSGLTEFALKDGELISLSELKVAFNKPPNRYSANALELYLAQKILNEKLSKSTADAIHGAFAHYWDRMDEQLYAGKYSYDRATGKVHGCPARAPVVREMMTMIKNRSHTKGEIAERQHAVALTIGDMGLILDASEKMCPNSMFDTMPPDTSNLDLTTIQLMNEHGLFRAFATTGFNLFTRNFETASLQFGDFTFNLQGPAPEYHPHFEVRLEERKGWQKQKDYEGPRTANTYDIYQQSIHEIDMYSHLLRWLSYLETRLGRILEATDYIFPRISLNGTIDPKEHISYDSAANSLSNFTRAAGITKNYTTHCFRRGGAQYRFMFAPPGQRWSLSVIRWWGGWAMGENVDTLMKYLLDSLQSYETGHRDALCPEKQKLDDSFMGEKGLLRPSTYADHLEIRRLQIESANRMEKIMHQLEFRLANIHVIPQLTHVPSNEFYPGIYQDPPVLHPYASYSSMHSYPHLLPSCFHHSGSPAFLYPNIPTSNFNPFMVEAQREARPIIAEPYALYPPAFYTPAVNYQPHTQPNSIHSARHTPIPKAPKSGVMIPNLPRGPQAWKEAIIQWERGGPKLLKPLKDWDPDMYSDDMKKYVGVKRGQRELIFKEYEKLGRNDDAFVKCYPEAQKGVRQLLTAIQQRVCHRRRSKNGTPSEREVRQKA